MSEDTLLIRHLPNQLTADEITDFLQHFGAKHVRVMGDKGPLKHVAFATFVNHSEAKCAMFRLHQMNIFNTRLVVEFAKKKHNAQLPKVSDDYKSIQEKQEKQEKENKIKEEIVENKQITLTLNQISKKWGLEYPYNPRLQYLYPPPTSTTLSNIMHALATLPKFYVQVLHLMNKFSLPAPFGKLTNEPPIKEAVAKEQEITLMEEEGTDESEIESAEEEMNMDNLKNVNKITKRKQHSPNKPRKKLKLRQLISVPTLPGKPKVAAQDTSDVFEQAQSTIKPKKIDLNLNIGGVSLKSAGIDENTSSPLLSNGEVTEHENTTPADSLAKTDMLSAEASTTSHDTLGGFGKLEPQPVSTLPIEEVEIGDFEWDDGEFISSRRLRSGLITGREMRELNIFKNYQEGEPTSRLYIKNLSRTVSQSDLHYIFGRYVDWQCSEEKTMFDIRLMQEGRMKGQAFVTLPSETCAKHALRDTNGFKLKDKPIVVQFARSAKPKETDAKIVKKK